MASFDTDASMDCGKAGDSEGGMAAESNLVCSVCAACGKGGDGLKTCNGCKIVKYCNRQCQIDHRPKHRAACKKRAAELFDEQLFKRPQPRGDCPICYMKLPWNLGETRYQACCGNVLCMACMVARIHITGEVCCPFCRKAFPTVEEDVERLKERMKLKDAEAFFNLGWIYSQGFDGVLQQNPEKALELLLQAAKLGSTRAHYKFGHAYLEGDGAEYDAKKAIHHLQIAAMGGDEGARHDLGIFESRRGNAERALKHFEIAASDGFDESLESIRGMFLKGLATKEEYEKSLRAHKEAADEMKSEHRERNSSGYREFSQQWRNRRPQDAL